MTGRLLVLDDEAMIAATVAMIAESAGFEAMSTAVPAEFFRLLEDWRPSHIAIDLVMPEMDGVQVMTRLAVQGCRAGIIVTSGVSSRVLDAARRSAALNGLRIIGTLSKPFTPAALRSLLQAEVPDAHGGSVTGAHDLSRRATADPGIGARDLLRALAEDELFLVYQPQVDCRSGELRGFEALVRWRHPRLGIVTPDRFIPVAEELGLIDAVTDRVVDQGLAWFAEAFPHRRHDMPALPGVDGGAVTLSINMSAASIGDREPVEDLLAACGRHGVAPERIILELTETSAMRDPAAALEQLTRMRMKGFQLSIDDFGTGYSSMLQLARLPFSEIKVDKSFVLTAMQSKESRAVIRSVVELGKGFGLRTVAEGVEDAGTLEYLNGLGCEIVQGYHIARPMADADVPAWLAASRRRLADARGLAASAEAAPPVQAFRWDDCFLTGLEEVDQQHQRLVELVNRFGSSLLQDDGIPCQDLDVLFSELSDYTKYHFAEEETMMVSAGLDERYIAFHRSEHANLVSELLHLQECADAASPASLQPALRFLVHWVAYHILGVDQGMARQVSAVREGVPAREAAERERPGAEVGRQPLVEALVGLFELLSLRNRQLRDAHHRLSTGLPSVGPGERSTDSSPSPR